MSNLSTVLDVISYQFNRINPKLFIAIGDHAKYVQCVPQPILGLGIDVWPSMNLKSLPANQLVYPVSSDYFFHSPYMIQHIHPDIVLISGFYKFEQVLRDVMFSEKLCKKESIIMFTNTVPLADGDVERDDLVASNHHTGDVFKIIPIFRKYRPSVKISTLTDVDKGITILENLDESDHTLQHEMLQAAGDVFDLTFAQRDTSTDMTFEQYKAQNS